MNELMMWTSEKRMQMMDGPEERI